MGEVSKTVAKKPNVKKENSASKSQKTPSFHSENPSIDRILFLQRTVGNQAVQKLIKSGKLQTNLKISQPGDIYEQQAEKVAEQVVSSTPATQVTSIKGLPGDEKHVQRKEGTSGTYSPDSVVLNPGQGQPINISTRRTLESHLSADLSSVRIHNDSSAHEAASALNAKAFTYGNNIWLGKGESQDNLRLMAHETTHVVQQGHSISRMPVGVKTSTPASAVRHTNGAVVQRSIFSSLKNLMENQIWELLNKYAPELVQIMKKGFFVWLEEKITSVVDNLFDTLMAPVRSLTGIVQSVSKHFTSLLTWMQEAAVKISKGDCSSISEAAEKISKVIDGLASPIIDKVKNLAKKVGTFFTGLWDRFGAPVWDFLKSAGGAAWEKIQQLGKLIWDKTAPVRKVFSRAWGWIKNKLGIGEETEGQNKQGKVEETEGQDGILQWVKRKASDLWDEKIKPFIIRFKKPLMVVAGVLVMLSPAGPLVAIGAGAVGLIKGIRWISQYMKKPQNVVQQQGILKGTILPGLMGAVNSVKASLRKAAMFVTSSLNKVIEGLTQALSAVSGSVLNFVVGALQWIIDQFQGLVAWADEKLTSLVDVISSGLELLNEFLRPIFGVLEKIGDVVSDIMNLTSLVLGKFWNMIPACIRNPLINFLINQILKNIPILGDVIELVPTLWSEIKVTALTIIKKVFKDGDLIGAVFEIFKLVLRVLNIPMELLVSVIDKAGSAIDLVIKKPFRFLGNLLLAIKNGFIQFGKNILSHLLSGLKNWLFGAVAGTGIHLPEDLSIKSIFNFILEVLDITVEKVLVRLEKKFGPEKIAPVRKAIGVISQVWDWISTLLEEGPEGVWNKLKEKLGDLWTTLIGEISTWITVNVIVNAIARLSTTLAGGPVGPVVQGLISLYKAIQSVMRYARQLLEIVDLVLDNITTIVNGSIGTAATKVEDALERSLTVALGFLANQVGLGNLEKKVSKIMESIRNKIIDGIDWLINKALKVGGALIGLVKGKGKKGAASNDRRRPEEKKMDLQAAEIELRHIVNNSETTADVEAHFPQLMAQYRLKKIDWVAPGKIGIEINPKAVIEIKGKQLFLNTGDTSHAKMLDLLGGQLVEFKTKILDKETVGDEMIATRLGPNHPQGGPPTAQKDIMNKLPTNPHYPATQKYIRGHLLNDNLGGPGDAANLFPITAQANREHEMYVESKVKKWVNKDGFWVYYRVKVANIKYDFNNHNINKRYVNADFQCEVQKLDVNGKLSGKGFTHTIFSIKGTSQIGASNPNVTADKGASSAQKDKFEESKVELSTAKAEESAPESLNKKIRDDAKILIDHFKKLVDDDSSMRTFFKEIVPNASQVQLSILLYSNFDVEKAWQKELKGDNIPIGQWNLNMNKLNKKKDELMESFKDFSMAIALENVPDNEKGVRWKMRNVILKIIKNKNIKKVNL